MEQLKNWIPYSLKYNAGKPELAWLDLADHEVKEPFFDETIILCKCKMIERSKYKPYSSVEFLVEQAKQIEALKPTAFIFHVSRCGSTLLSQLLSTDSKNIVIAEAPLLDEILRAGEFDNQLEEKDIEEWFKSALKMMGQSRNQIKQRYFIKLDSWHMHFYKELRNWFPNVPFYFLSREPKAIIASHIKRRGIHAIPGIINPALLKINLTSYAYQDFNQYTAQVLSHYYQTLSDIAKMEHPLNHFFDYNWGTEQMIQHFLDAIHLEIHDDLMLSRLNYHSKYPDQVFKEDETNIADKIYPEALTAYHELAALLISKIQYSV